MNIQLKKTKFGRRRFLKTAPLAHPANWLTNLASLKTWIAEETQFQIVGRKTILEINGGDLCLMLEVVGVPRNLEQKPLFLIDLEAGEGLVYDLKDADLFSTDLSSILESARIIHKVLSVGDNQLYPSIHLVLDEEKIALHFFRQKDYSQNLLS